MDNIATVTDFLTSRNIHYMTDVSLKEYCTFKIGGIAAFMVFPATQEQLADLFKAARQWTLPRLVIGKGSNLLFSDNGFQGVVICLGSRFSKMERLDDTAILCQSGASLALLCRFACEQGLSGLEFAYGIPGSVGGAIYMNAGAYGGEMGDVLESTRHLMVAGTADTYNKKQLNPGYRHSAYMETGHIITHGVFRLTQGNPKEIRSKMDGFLQRRRDKQPLDFPSAGSVFRRPQGAYASALVDQCGLKGLRIGGAQVSEKHAGFIINRENATCRDVLQLIGRVQDEVFNRTGYRLECEIKTID